MSLINLKDPKLYILGVVALIIVLIIIFLFRHFVVKRRRARKTVLDLERKYEHLHALLIGQNSQYIRRLEIISASNLLYVEIHDKFLSRYQIILESSDKQAQYAIAYMEELVVQKKYSDFRASFDKNNRIVELFEAQVKELTTDLESILKEEERCRAEALKLKEKFKTIRSVYFEKQSELMIIEDAFTKTFNGIEYRFGEYEKFVESAYYEEANALLPIINAMIDELGLALKELPAICCILNVTIEEKLEEIRKEEAEIRSLNIPIHHLQVNTSIARMKQELYEFGLRLNQFKYKGLKERLTKMLEQLDEFHDLFEKEKQAKLDFENEVESIYEKVAVLERQFIILRQRLLKVKEIFRLEDSYFEKMDLIQTQINQLGITKRQLDTYIHSSTKQPYSMLLCKMNELKSQALETGNNIDDFNNYVDSLKVDSDDAYNLVNDSYIQLKKIEKMARDIAVSTYLERIKDRFSQCYQYLDNIYSLLIVKPINVKQINEYVRSFKVVFIELATEVKEQYRLCNAAEAIIVEANVERTNNAELDKCLIRAERYFETGDFEKAYQEVSTALKKINSNA